MVPSVSTPKPCEVAITLNAVFTAIENDAPKVLCVDANDGETGLPYGPFDPSRHRTFEIGMREWVEKQTHLTLGHIEQLYTFGDRGRETPAATFKESDQTDRVISVGYLALAREPARTAHDNASWRDWYSFFPWEDWRDGEPTVLRSIIKPRFLDWLARSTSKEERELRERRLAVAFGLGGNLWDEARTLDRYELMYEAGIVEEANRARGKNEEPPSPAPSIGITMISDHRRILATAIGRLRGKIRYRPVVFDLAPPQFTLLQLQHITEATLGFRFHKQNFRRSVEKSGFIKRTNKTTSEFGGRPAALFRTSQTGLRDLATTGLTLPRFRADSD